MANARNIDAVTMEGWTKKRQKVQATNYTQKVEVVWTDLAGEQHKHVGTLSWPDVLDGLPEAARRELLSQVALRALYHHLGIRTLEE